MEKRFAGNLNINKVSVCFCSTEGKTIVPSVYKRVSDDELLVISYNISCLICGESKDFNY